MPPIPFSLRMILCSLLLITFQSAVADALLNGRPAQIISGDELILMTDSGTMQRIKLIGITTQAPNLPWGAAARRHLQSLVMGRSVTFFYRSKDQMGRALGQLRHGGADINIRQLSAGLGRFDPTGLAPIEAEEYAAAEQGAHKAGFGIWGSTEGETRPQARSVPGGPLFRFEQ